MTIFGGPKFSRILRQGHFGSYFSPFVSHSCLSLLACPYLEARPFGSHVYLSQNPQLPISWGGQQKPFARSAMGRSDDSCILVDGVLICSKTRFFAWFLKGGLNSTVRTSGTDKKTTRLKTTSFSVPVKLLLQLLLSVRTTSNFQM